MEDDLIEQTKNMVLARYPCFGSQIANAKIEYADCQTAETDGKNIFINPTFFKSLSPEMREVIIAHEIMHIKYEHTYRLMTKDGNIRDVDTWNTATDAIINANLRRDGYHLMEGVVDIPEALNYSAEEFYDKLMAEKKFALQNPNGCCQNGQNGQANDREGKEENAQNAGDADQGKQNQNEESSTKSNKSAKKQQNDAKKQEKNEQNQQDCKECQSCHGDKQTKSGGSKSENGGQNAEKDQNHQEGQSDKGYKQESGQGVSRQKDQQNTEQLGLQENDTNDKIEEKNENGQKGQSQNGGEGKETSLNSAEQNDDAEQSQDKSSNDGTAESLNKGGSSLARHEWKQMDSHSNWEEIYNKRFNPGKEDKKADKKHSKDDKRSKKEADDNASNIEENQTEDLSKEKVMQDGPMFRGGKGDQDQPKHKPAQSYDERTDLEANRQAQEQKAVAKFRDYQNIPVLSKNKFSFEGVGESKSVFDWKRAIGIEVAKYEDVWSQRRSIAENNYAYRLEEEETDSEAITEVIIDISGSVEIEFVKAFLRQLKPLVKDSKLKVGCFNERFWGFTEVKTIRDIDRFSIPKEALSVFYCGTYMDVAVRAFSKGSNVNKIVFTDGYPSQGHMPPLESKKENIIWVVYENLDFNPCCGKVIFVPNEDLLRTIVPPNDTERHI